MEGIDNESVIHTALSVACEALVDMIKDTGSGDPRMGFAGAAVKQIKAEMDAFLVDRDWEHMTRANEIIQSTNAQLQEWRGQK